MWSDLKLENFVMVPKQPSVFTSLKEYSLTKLRGAGTAETSTINSLVTACTCKAIDLESAVQVGKPLRDFSPETCAPELLELLASSELSSINGRDGDLQVSFTEVPLAAQALDVWALGISMLHLCLGR